MSLSDTRLILSEEDIKYPVQPILDDPMLTNKAAGVGRGELGEAAQVRAVLNAHGFAQHLTAAVTRIGPSSRTLRTILSRQRG